MSDPASDENVLFPLHLDNALTRFHEVVADAIMQPDAWKEKPVFPVADQTKLDISNFKPATTERCCYIDIPPEVAEELLSGLTKPDALQKLKDLVVQSFQRCLGPIQGQAIFTSMLENGQYRLTLLVRPEHFNALDEAIATAKTQAPETLIASLQQVGRIVAEVTPTRHQ